jgi:hypothetical protein
MEEITISKFKATCIATLERVRKMRLPIRITRFGKPFVDLLPPKSKPKKKAWIGSMAGTIQIKGDLVYPANDAKDWEVLNS